MATIHLFLLLLSYNYFESSGSAMCIHSARRNWNLNMVGHRLVRSLLVNAIKRFVGSETCHNSPKSFQILLRHSTTCYTSEFYEPEASWHILLQRLELKKKMLVNHVKSYS